MKYKFHFSLTFLLLLFNTILYGANGSLTGHIRDIGTHQLLVGVSVMSSESENK